MKVPAWAWLALVPPAAWAGLRLFEHAMLYHPSRVMTAHPGTVGLRWEPLSLRAADGVRVRAWWIPGPREDSPAMLCLHGNGGNLSHRVDKMRIFHDAGAAQLWVEWRGYGESEGRPSEAGLVKDAEAGLGELLRRGVPPARLFVYGESLGSGPAAELASRGGLGGLVLEGAFSSIRDMARLVLPRLPAFLVRTRFEVKEKASQLAMPALVLHSPEDRVIPYEQGRAVYDAIPSPKRFVELRGGHDDAFLEAGPAYRAAIKDFLSSPPAPPAKGAAAAKGR